MLFVQLVIRNLAGRKVHAALIIFTLAIAVAATILLFGAAWGFADAATASLEGRGVDIVITRSGVVERANSSLRADQAHILSKLPGVVAVDGTLQETVSLKTKGFADHPHLLLGQDPRGFSLKSLQIQAGQTLAAEDRGSVASVYGPHCLAVILTGMGQDGLRGCEAVRAAGGQVLVQDEASSVVWGMPGFVARAGLADKVLPLSLLAGEIVRRVRASRG